MPKLKCKLSLIISFVWFIMLMSPPAHAQWPPFTFILTPLHEDGRITYNLEFIGQVDWTIVDATIKVPLPEGTRFVDSSSIPIVETSFDGAEVTFSIPVLSRRIKEGDASFVVEIIDPTKTVFSTQPWIVWQGNQPGDYLAEPVSINIMHQTLNWEKPAPSRLQLRTEARAFDDVITYFIYPQNVGGRMWDVKINIPIPEGSEFLSAEASAPFVANFNGKEVSFLTSELDRWGNPIVLSFKVSTAEVIAPFVTTHVWATWKNSGRPVGRRIVSQEEMRTSDIIVQAHASQFVVSDPIDDVPFSNYDLSEIVLQEVILPKDELALKVIFRTVEDIDLIGNPLAYNLYIDNDCQSDTGQKKRRLGVEYILSYKHDRGQATIMVWDQDEQEGRWHQINSLVNDKTVSVWAPYRLLKNGQQFCWMAEAQNRTTTFNPAPPIEKIPNSEYAGWLSYEAKGADVETEIGIKPAPAELSTGTFIRSGDIWQYLPGWSEPTSAWNTIDFDDSNWFSGQTSIGYGIGGLATSLSLDIRSIEDDEAPVLVQRTDKQAGMTLAVLPSGDEGSLFMRRVFTVTNPASLTQLALKINYKGGFVAYLNGLEVARQGLGPPGSPVFYNTLADDHNVNPASIITDLSEYINTLVGGPNVLAIQGHQSLNDDTSLLMDPELVWEFDPADVPVVETPPIVDAKEAVPSTTTPPVTKISSGKLAIPIDNGQVAYDIHVFSLPDGEEIVKIPNARQPNFRFDGQRILINREGGGVENVFEYNFVDGTEKQVSDAPQDWHPFYDPWGNRVVYGNAELTVGSLEPLRDEKGNVVHDKTGEVIYHSPKKPFIFVQCSLLPPHQEVDARCKNIAWLGVLVPAGQVGEIQGTHPVWAQNDMISYKGCNSWAGFSSCGIYIVPSSSTKGFSDGFIPRQLTQHTSDIPTDTKGNLIAFMSERDGNWEAYVMGLNGDGLENLSNSPESNDGLPTISPDGNWVAYVSDRGGQWGVWAVPTTGGQAKKLFNVPDETPWGDGSRNWTNERISWGP